MPATPRQHPRPWWWDALAAFVCFLQAFAGAKFLARIFGPFAGLFALLFFAGLGWFFAKAAWRGLMEKRSG